MAYTDFGQNGLIQVKLAVAKAKREKEVKQCREVAVKIKELKKLKALRDSTLTKALYDRERAGKIVPGVRRQAEKFHSFDCIPRCDRKKLDELEMRAVEVKEREQAGKNLEVDLEVTKRRITALKDENHKMRAQLKSKTTLTNHAEALKRQIDHYKESLELKTARLVARRGELRRALQSK